MKRTPLTRKAAPARRAPLKASPALPTAKALKSGVRAPRAPRNTGPGVAVRAAVAGRAQGRCERCGQTITGEYSIHHRKPRGMGGTKDPAANSPANLALLCGSATTPGGCHTSVEKFREAAVFTGWIVPRTQDPAAVPIKQHDGWWLLNHEGTRTPTERPEEQEEDGDD